MIRALRITHFALILLLVGCSSLAPLLSTPTPVPVVEATSTPQTIPTATQPAAFGTQILRVWLPPHFDPDADTPSAALLRQHLLDFANEHPRIQVEIRIKSTADIMKTLSVTSKAAPEAMPDLILLSYSNMQAVGSAGYLHPLDGLTTILQDPDWYAFARELGHIQNTEYGIPFACDVLLRLYHPAVFSEPPSTWEALFESGTYMAFPVSDPKALFSLSLYLSENERLVDGQGVVALDEQTLVRLLTYYKDAIETQTALPLIKGYQSDTESLKMFREGGADLAVIWASSDIQVQSGAYLPLLGLNNTNYSLGDGWVWALAGSNVENQPLAAELASYFVESNFMSEWTRSAGYLPVRPQALAGWDDEQLNVSINEVLQSAHALPSDEVISVVGPLLQEALIRIFNGEQVEVVARSVIEAK